MKTRNDKKLVANSTPRTSYDELFREQAQDTDQHMESSEQSCYKGRPLWAVALSRVNFPVKC